MRLTLNFLIFALFLSFAAEFPIFASASVSRVLIPSGALLRQAPP